MKKIRIGRVIAAVSAVALLAGGIVFLTRDGVSQKIKDKELKPFMLTPRALTVLDNAAEQAENEDISQIIPLDKNENIGEAAAVPDILSENIRTELIENTRSLNEAYPNAIGWIYLPGTSINYPIMQSDDNDFYLHHAYDNSYLKAGSVFLDYRCENRFMNNLNILYAHNMRNGSMFADVCRFKDKSYFESHRFGWLVTSDSVNRVDFFAVCVTDWNDGIYNGFQPIPERLDHISDISRIYEEIPISDNDRLLMLSTCSYEFENARTILIGKIMED